MVKQLVGWREWVALPDLGVKSIKAKVDTGARTSSLHAVDIETFRRRGKDWVRFVVHPEQRSQRREIHCQAPVLEYRKVRSSGGHTTERPVVLTELKIGDDIHEIELTLVDRDIMGFRMLLGRQALRRHFIVDPGASYQLGTKPKPKSAKKTRNSVRRKT